MHGCVGLCMAMHGFSELCMVMHDHALLGWAVLCPAWPCKAVLGCAEPCWTVQGRMQEPRFALHAFSRRSLTPPAHAHTHAHRATLPNSSPGTTVHTRTGRSSRRARPRPNTHSATAAVCSSGRHAHATVHTHPYAMPVVLDLQQPVATLFHEDADLGASGIKAVLQKLLECAGWALDDLARGDAIDNRLVKLTDDRLRRHGAAPRGRARVAAFRAGLRPPVGCCRPSPPTAQRLFGVYWSGRSRCDALHCACRLIEGDREAQLSVCGCSAGSSAWFGRVCPWRASCGISEPPVGHAEVLSECEEGSPGQQHPQPHTETPMPSGCSSRDRGRHMRRRWTVQVVDQSFAEPVGRKGALGNSVRSHTSTPGP
eukprot:242021-Chlamydomonas_euryale.AAC.3